MYASRVLLLGLVACLGAAWAQSVTGVITGNVTDPQGGLIGSAKVSIRNAESNAAVFEGTTNNVGLYQAPALPSALYDLHFEAPGFKSTEIRGVRLQVGQNLRVDAVLQVGAVTESVTVAASAVAALETENATTGAMITSSQVKDLPLPSRNVLNLLTLVGGVSSGGAATGINANQMSVNGSRTLNNELTVDGLSIVSGSTGGVIKMPSTEAVREFRVLTSGYSAEYGRTAGASVNVIVDSGTNDIHGGIYEFFRNEKLNANNFFRNARGEARPLDRYNQFGGKLGGPVFIPKLYNGKDRTFFFVNYEQLVRVSPYSNLATVPDPKLRQGDFSSIPLTINDPLTNAPFPSNRIPANRLDPAAVKILNLLPAPNSAGTADNQNFRTLNNFASNGSNRPGSKEITSRIDQNFSSASRLSGRWTWYRTDGPMEPVLPGPLENAVGDSVTTGGQFSLLWTHTWSPSVVTEVNAGYLRDNPVINPPSLGLDVAGVLGIARSVGGAAPVFNVSGWQQMGINSNTWRRQINNIFQYSGSLSWIRGSHIRKFGAQIRKNQFNVYNPGGLFTGTYSFTGQLTSPTRNGTPMYALADFLLGQVKTSNYELPQPLTGRRNYNLGVFFQDDWKVTRRLSVNLGLRYEFEAPMTMSNDMYSRVDSVTGKLLVAGKNASRSLNLEGDKLNLAPRVGLAYSLNDKTVIRSAFGVFFGQLFSNLGGQVAYPGFTVRQTFGDLGVGIAQPFRLSEGMPLLAVQNFDDPFFVERQATTANPLAPGAQFGEVNPLTYSMQWNFGIQRTLPARVLLDLSYIGSGGRNLPLSLPFNQVPYERGEELAGLASQTATQNARPFPLVNGFSSFVNAGSSSYHSLQVRGTRQLTQGFGLQATYTLSKSIDDGTTLFSFSAPNDVDRGQFIGLFRNLDRALSSFDRRHNFAMAVQYQTTMGPKWLRGIQVNPIITARQGLPDTIGQNNLHPVATQQRPNVINSNVGGYAPQRTSEGTAIRYLLSPSDPNFPFTPTGPLWTGSGATRRLVLPFTGPGTLSRNTTRDPNEYNMDLSVAKVIPIREKLRFTVRAEAFNVLNTVNLNGSNTGLTVITDPTSGRAVWNSPGFGLITGAKSARFMQFVARFDF